MVREINRLSDLRVRTLSEPGYHADGNGLYLLTTNGGKRWVLIYRWHGRRREMGLGSATAVSLKRARELAAKARGHLAENVDPLALRDAARAAQIEAEQCAPAIVTFRDAAESYIALNESRWKNEKHRWQWGASLEKFIYPHFGNLPVEEIGTGNVLAALAPIWATKSETARRLRGRIESILDAAKVRGQRTGENPARWRGHLSQVLPPVARHSANHYAAMPYGAVPDFAAALRTRRAMAARALEFTILTAARTGETIGATWREIDLDGAVWTVPATRMKAGVEHRVPLTARALQILREVRSRGTGTPDAPLFPSRRGGCLSNMAMNMLMRKMERSETVHGFRSAFRDWAAETTPFPFQVAEMALAHTIGNKSEAAYRRGELFPKRRELMNAWADHIDPPLQLAVAA